MAEQANGWFYNAPVENHVKSKKEGRPIFDDVAMCEITIPGDRKNKVVKYATEELKERFPQAWAAFEQATEQVGEGMPLEEWPIMTAGRVMELKSINIHTVEQLAGMNETFLKRLGMGGRQLMEQAKAFLVAAESGETAVAMENAELKQKVEALQAMVSKDGNNEVMAEENQKLKTRVAELEAEVAQLKTAAETPAPASEPAPEAKTETKDEVQEKPAEGEAPAETEEAKAQAAADEKAEKEAAAKAAHDAEVADLRKQIEANTGEPIKGNPSLKTLREMAAE